MAERNDKVPKASIDTGRQYTGLDIAPGAGVGAAVGAAMGNLAVGWASASH